MQIPANVAAFWNDFVESVDGIDDARFYEAFCFGDSEALAAELAALVLSGTKLATAGLLTSFTDAGKRLPTLGDLSVVTNWAGAPLCIIETRSVEVVPFAQVTAEFAATEGEGDGSLAFWREAHHAFFTRECATAGCAFTEDMLVVCERFRVVYQPV